MGMTREVRMAAMLCLGLTLVGCGRSPADPVPPAASAATAEEFSFVEVVARPVGQSPGNATRPAHPDDAIELSLKSQGSTRGADLSVKMIALADGSTAGVRKLRLNAGNAAAPKLVFEPGEPWRVGRYLFEVSLNGKLAGSQELEIFPAEPDAPAQ